MEKTILKELRKRKGCKQKEVAQILCISESQLSDYESGRKNLGMAMAIKFADYYKVSLDYITGREVISEITEKTEIERIVADNNFSNDDEKFLKGNQEQLVQLLKDKQTELDKKQAEIDELKKENQELKSLVDTNIN